MRRAILSSLLLAGCAQPPATRGGIVSTNPCADAMLVRLVRPERIAAISHYSTDAGSSSIPAATARRFRSTAGTAEEVIALRPELVVTSSFAPAPTLAAYRRAGLRVLVLDSPASVAASRAQVIAVAAAVGAEARGKALVREIDVALETGAGPSRGKRDPAALLYIAGDLANGAGTLLDELTRRAGFRNAAADYGLAFTGTLPLEQLVGRPPDVVIGAGDGRTAALRRRLLPDTPVAGFARNLVNCGGPTIPAALARLRAIRASL